MKRGKMTAGLQAWAVWHHDPAQNRPYVGNHGEWQVYHSKGKAVQAKQGWHADAKVIRVIITPVRKSLASRGRKAK